MMNITHARLDLRSLFLCLGISRISRRTLAFSHRLHHLFLLMNWLKASQEKITSGACTFLTL